MTDPDAKRRYTTRVAVALGVGVVLMFVGPMAAVFVPMIALMASGGLFRVPLVREVAIWEGALYWTSVSPRNRLWRTELGSGETKEAGVSSAGFPSLVSTPTGLWLFGRLGVDRYDGGSVTRISSSPGTPLASLFVYRGKPALIDVEPTRMLLHEWDGASWAFSGEMSCDCALVSETRVRAVEHDGGLALLVLDGSLLMYRHAKLGERVGNPKSWTQVARDVWHYEAGPTSGGSFAVVAARSPTRSSTEIELYRWDGASLGPSVKTVIRSSLHDFGVATDPDSDVVHVVGRGMPQSDLLVTSIDRSGRVDARPAGGKGFFQVMLWPYAGAILFNVAVCLTLALLLSRWMRTFRGDELVIEGRTVELASLTRRGLAQLVDSVFHSLPLLIVAASFAAGKLDWGMLFMSPRGTLYLLGFVVVSLVWGLLSFVLMAAAEARRGKTPGKVLFGIRTIGVDLEPCGFGRALLRNMCEYADGMLTFAVGMAVVALTEKRQRLGDLAARTLVIKDER